MLPPFRGKWSVRTDRVIYKIKKKEEWMLQTSGKPLPPLQGTFPASGDGIFIAPAKLPFFMGIGSS